MITAFAIVVLTTLPSMGRAQVELPTDQLDQQANLVRQRMLRDATVNRHRAGSANHALPTKRQAAGCARKGAWRAQYGAADLKVRKLYSLCRAVGL